jgi:hypothetical protein
MLISEALTQIQSETGYVQNSLIIKSSDAYGATYKWLFRYVPNLATRREVFFAAVSVANDVVADRTIIDQVEVGPAG